MFCYQMSRWIVLHFFFFFWPLSPYKIVPWVRQDCWVIKFVFCDVKWIFLDINKRNKPSFCTFYSNSLLTSTLTKICTKKSEKFRDVWMEMDIQIFPVSVQTSAKPPEFTELYLLYFKIQDSHTWRFLLIFWCSF